MDSLLIQLRTKTVQLGLQMILFLHLTSFLFPRDTPVSELHECYDYIIVGCGTAGSILANRLSASGQYQVLAIEAGGDPPLESVYPSTFPYLVNSKYDWNFTTINDGYTAQGHRKHILELTKGKMLGGDSSLGHQLYIRGHPHDYNKWAEELDDPSWSYDNLLPYFKKSEDFYEKGNHNHKIYHGTEGNIGVIRNHKHLTKKYLHAFEKSGQKILHDGNGRDTFGYHEAMVTVKDGLRQSTALSFLSPIKYRTNLHLLKETEVIEIIFDGNTAIGVIAVKNGRKFQIKVRKEVIVSAGTMKSPHLLMLSGIGHRDHLESYGISVRKDLPVGRHYQDHLGVMMVHKFNRFKSHHSRESVVYPDPHEYPLNLIIGNVAVDKSQHRPEYQSLNYIISSHSDDLLSLCSISFSFNNELCQSLYNKTKGYEAMVSKIILLHPKSRGHVVLQSKDYRYPPIIISGFYSRDKDLENMIKFLADFRQISQTPLFSHFGTEMVHPKLDECDGYPNPAYWKCYALNMMTTAYHYTSTCSMGHVVDGRLKVYGIERLRVIDASVIPLITSGHAQAAVMAVAEKGADMILEDAKTLPARC